MKKLACLTLALLMLILRIPVAATQQAETSLSTGDRDVLFSNGYRGFCIDRSLSGAYTGDSFVAESNTSSATNNNQNLDVSQALKVLFTQCFTDVFVSDGNGGYTIQDTNTVQAVVWHFSDDQYVWGEQLRLVNLVKAYNGPEIPDDGYVLRLDNGDVITFSFTVMTPQKEGQQSFFAYKLTVGQEEAHTHEYSQVWSADGTDHWHECECGDTSDKASHSGGTANCNTPATCEICQTTYGTTDPNTHTGQTEVRGYLPATTANPGYTGDTHCADCGQLLNSGEEIPQLHSHEYSQVWSADGTDHWHECECGDTSDKASHSGGTANCNTPATCEICQTTYGTTDPNTHTGQTEVRGYLPATTENPGYTGDTHCADCGQLLNSGEEIPQLHSHEYSQVWSADGTDHWHECECGNKQDKQKHTYTAGKCTVCQAVDPHYTGETPQTGDGFLPILWLTLSLASLGGCLWLMLYRKKLLPER